MRTVHYTVISFLTGGMLAAQPVDGTAARYSMECLLLCVFWLYLGMLENNMVDRAVTASSEIIRNHFIVFEIQYVL